MGDSVIHNADQINKFILHLWRFKTPILVKQFDNFY